MLDEMKGRDGCLKGASRVHAESRERMGIAPEAWLPSSAERWWWGVLDEGDAELNQKKWAGGGA